MKKGKKFFQSLRLEPSFQLISLEERPHPYPLEHKPLSPDPSLNDEICQVEGWNLYLDENTRYRVTCDFARNEVWPEIEVVTYSHCGDGVWKRMESFGAVTTVGNYSELTTQTSGKFVGAQPVPRKVFVAVFGKRAIDRVEPWYNLMPASTFKLDNEAGLLKLHFFTQPETARALSSDLLEVQLQVVRK